MGENGQVHRFGCLEPEKEIAPVFIAIIMAEHAMKLIWSVNVCMVGVAQIAVFLPQKKARLKYPFYL